MRGNKFLKPCVVVALLMVAMATVFALPTRSIKNVKAEDNSIYNNTYVSQKYTDGVVLSVEQVYFAEDRTEELTYSSNGSDNLTNILGYGNNANYFANYGLTSSNNSKKIVRSGEYVMLDSMITRDAYSGSGSVALKQGVMITLGGYVFDENNELHTNSEGYVDGEQTSDYMSELQSVSVSISKTTGTVTQTTDFDASLRTYKQGLYFDFVHFISAGSDSEGHYQISINYTKAGSSPQSHSFEFFILNQASYTQSVEVNSVSYNSAPNLSINAINDTDKKNNYNTTTSDEPVVLTYNYKYYDLSFTYEANDLGTSVEVEVVEDGGEKQIVLNYLTNGEESSDPPYECEINNDIVSFVFASKGSYKFEFDYVYYFYNKENSTIERRVVKNLSIDPIALDIYGYELKYKKTGFNSADMKNYDIVKNGTTIIAVNGYNNSKISSVDYDLNKDLGYMYNFVSPNGYQKTGAIAGTKTADITNYVNTNLADKANPTADELANISYTETDQGGLFLSLTDYYSLDASYYIYSATPFVSSGAYEQTKMTKATDFTKHGYYFVCVGYSETDGGETKYQYFAFRSFSATAKIELYTTDAQDNSSFDMEEDSRIYSNQYTNKNVYGYWEEPSEFTSKQNVTITYALQGNKRYWSKESMLAFSEGKEANNQLTTDNFNNKSTLVSQSGSYLLTVEVEGKKAKAVYYFVIDKDEISGIDVLGVSSVNVGNTKVFNIARDEQGNPISYTEKVLINSDFTLWWDNKGSGATITAYYQHTSFKQDNTKTGELSGTAGGVDYNWILTNYTKGNTSNKVKIEKPSSKTAMVSAENVRTEQGVYWFYLEDQAGNTREYVIIYDNTPIQISAETVNDGTSISNGDLVAEDVAFDWGTHKAIELGEYDDGDDANLTINEKLYKQFIAKEGSSNYFDDNGSNATAIVNNFKVINNKLYIIVKNEYITIQGSHTTSLFTMQSNGSYFSDTNWSQVAKNNNTNCSVKIECLTQEISYTLCVYGENHTSSKQVSNFTITLNPDKSEGKVLSYNESSSEAKKVWAYNNSYVSEQDKVALQNNYLESHATTDELLVFEWFADEGGDFEVAEVYYEYYPLLSQDELNSYNYNSSEREFDFFPYDYSNNSTKNYISGGSQNAKNYTLIEDNGKTKYRSNALNVGYTTYFDQEGNLVPVNATLPGLYIIYRTYEEGVKAGENDSQTRIYVFSVDRKGVIEYSMTDYKTKVVGSYIDLLVQEKIEFDSFTQAVDQYDEGEASSKVSYDLYLQTNRLPLEIRVPTGKFVKVNQAGEIVRTSNSRTAGLKLNIKFVDKYNYLGLDSNLDDKNYASFTLFEMTDMDMDASGYIKNGYINFKLSSEKLYQGDGAQSWLYLLACEQTGNKFLSLPGIYIFEVVDNTGSEMLESSAYTLSAEPQTVSIGVEITQTKPNVVLYSSHTTQENTSTNGILNSNLSYAEFDVDDTDGNVKFDYSTSKAYIRYELPIIDENSTVAQLNPDYIYILQNNNLYYDSITNQGIINRNSQFDVDGEKIKFIQELNGKYVIWLDTGLTVENGKIIDYKEFNYTINVRYDLGENDKYLNSYSYYQIENGERTNSKLYYETTFSVMIDRTASIEILDYIIKNSNAKSQADFLNNFIKEQAQADFEVGGKIENSTIYNTMAYRAQDGQDYYAVVNKLYYYYLEKGDFDKAEQAIYPIRVNASENYNLGQSTNKTSMYYRKLSTDNKASQRMAIIPVTSLYDKLVSGFITFSPTNLSSFTKIPSSSNESWANMLGASEAGYYEIIEIDACGNMTQYVICLVYDSVVDTDNFNLSLTFDEDGDGENGTMAKFNFAKINSQGGLDLDNPSMNITNISLNYFSAKKITLTADLPLDSFYKIQLIDANTNQLYLNYYQNYTNQANMAENIEEVLNENNIGNYRLIITNRYNKTLTLAIDIYEPDKEYKLNEDNFGAKQDAEGNWYVDASDLTSEVDGVALRAVSIVLNSANNDDIDWSEEQDTTIIDLVSGAVYNATITDSKGQIYTKLIRAYKTEGIEDSSIDIYGKEEVINNIHYSANPVKVEFNANRYSSQKLKIVKDGVVIFNGLISSLPNAVDGIHTVYGVEIKNTAEASQQTLIFYPYLIGGNKGVGYTGAKLEFELTLNAIDSNNQTYNFVIDNRIPAVNLINKDLEDKTDIIETQYQYSKADELVVLDYDNLFDNLDPSITLSETVILNWSDYSTANYPYYETSVTLIKWNSKTDWTDNFDLSNKQITLTPIEFELGRYCFIIQLKTLSGELICYKAYAFNIATTANAMYEVLDNNGKAIDYQTTMKGEEIWSALTLEVITDIKKEFIKDGEETDFKQQVVPIYISNSALSVISNGKNGITTSSYSYQKGEYKLTIYKVYNDVHTTYIALLQLNKTDTLLTSQFYFATANSGQIEITSSLTSKVFNETGTLYFKNFYQGGVGDSEAFIEIAKENKLYLDIYYQFSHADEDTVYLGKFEGDSSDNANINKLTFNKAGRYLIYLKDYAGNIMLWNKGGVNESEYFTLAVLPEVIISVNGQTPVDYAFYNVKVEDGKVVEGVTVSVGFVTAGYYANSSVQMFAYLNGSTTDYITSTGGRKTNLISSFTFTDYGTYKVVIKATSETGKPIDKTLIFSILNPDEARLALDFTSISKYKITKVVNHTTGLEVTEIFDFLLNESFIYSKLITFERLSAENAFGSTMGKQTFEVFYTVDDDPLVPAVSGSFKFTINNQTPSLKSSISPGKSTTKNIKVTFNAQTIYRQVGDCHIVVNDQVLMTINEETAVDVAQVLTLKNVGDYYVKIVSDSGRVLSSFKVTIKEPLNTWSILLIVGAVILVAGIITAFIILRTKMRVR